MWTASWNAKGYTPLYTAINSGGYYIGTATTPSSYEIDFSGENGYCNTLYFPHTDIVTLTYNTDTWIIE